MSSDLSEDELYSEEEEVDSDQFNHIPDESLYIYEVYGFATL